MGLPLLDLLAAAPQSAALLFDVDGTLAPIVGDPAEDRVDEATHARRGEADGLADGGVARHPAEEQLVGTEPQHGPHGGIGGREHVSVDGEIERPTHPGGAVDQVRGEGTVSGRQPAGRERRRKREVGVRAVAFDSPEDIEGDRSRGDDLAHGHHTRHSPGSGRAPFAQASAAIGALPSGWTVTRRSAPLPQATISLDLNVEPLMYHTEAPMVGAAHPLAHKDHVGLTDLVDQLWLTSPIAAGRLRYISRIFQDAGFEPPSRFFSSDSPAW